MMLRRAVPVVLFSVVWPFAASPAAADPVRITSGTLVVTGIVQAGSLEMVGTQGFSLSAIVVNSSTAFHTCAVPACVGGTPLDLFIQLGFGGDTLANARATLNGVEYPEVDTLTAPAFTHLFFRGTAIAPPLSDQPTTVTAPFTLDGGFFTSLEGQLAELTGAGTATLSLRPYGAPESPPSWFVERIQYDFSAPAPVPEPATLALVGGGLVSLLASRRRRRASSPIARGD